MKEVWGKKYRGFYVKTINILLTFLTLYLRLQLKNPYGTKFVYIVSVSIYALQKVSD